MGEEQIIPTISIVIPCTDSPGVAGRHKMGIFVKKGGVPQIFNRGMELESTLRFANFGENEVIIVPTGTLRERKFLDCFGFACKTKR
jgi:hypothetical protein